jgi:hypothetical protein
VIGGERIGETSSQKNAKDQPQKGREEKGKKTGKEDSEGYQILRQKGITEKDLKILAA